MCTNVSDKPATLTLIRCISTKQHGASCRKAGLFNTTLITLPFFYTKAKTAVISSVTRVHEPIRPQDSCRVCNFLSFWIQLVWVRVPLNRNGTERFIVSLVVFLSACQLPPPPPGWNNCSWYLLTLCGPVVTICTASLTFTILRSVHTLYLCVLCGSENKQRLLPYTTLTFYNWEVVCLLRGTDWVFTFNSGYCYCLKLCTSALIRNQNSVDLVSSQDSTLYITINSWTFQAC